MRHWYIGDIHKLQNYRRGYCYPEYMIVWLKKWSTLCQTNNWMYVLLVWWIWISRQSLQTFQNSSWDNCYGTKTYPNHFRAAVFMKSIICTTVGQWHFRTLYYREQHNYPDIKASSFFWLSCFHKLYLTFSCWHFFRWFSIK